MTRPQVAHLLNRAGFGARAHELDLLEGLTRPELVDWVLDTSANPASSDTPGCHAEPEHDGEAEWRLWTDMTWYWLDRMATVPAPLQEKMTLFWHGYFTSEQRKVYDCRRLWLQNQTVRRLALGRFDDLLQAIAIDPGMLLYLDNAQNGRWWPQENFGRELLELFTIGLGEYTQADVVGAARAWTGHSLEGLWTKAGRVYRFYPSTTTTTPRRSLASPGTGTGRSSSRSCARARSGS